MCARVCLGAQIGVVIGYLVTGYITDALGWESSYYLFGLSAQLSLIFTYCLFVCVYTSAD